MLGDTTYAELELGCNVVQIRALSKLPPMDEMVMWSTLGCLADSLNAIDPILLPLLRWIISSSRAHIRKLRPEEVRACCLFCLRCVGTEHN